MRKNLLNLFSFLLVLVLIIGAVGVVANGVSYFNNDTAKEQDGGSNEDEDKDTDEDKSKDKDKDKDDDKDEDKDKDDDKDKDEDKDKVNPAYSVYFSGYSQLPFIINPPRSYEQWTLNLSEFGIDFAVLNALPDGYIINIAFAAVIDYRHIDNGNVVETGSYGYELGKIRFKKLPAGSLEFTLILDLLTEPYCMNAIFENQKVLFESVLSAIWIGNFSIRETSRNFALKKIEVVKP